MIVRLDLVGLPRLQWSRLVLNLVIVFQGLHKLNRFFVKVGTSVRRQFYTDLLRFSIPQIRNHAPLVVAPPWARGQWFRVFHPMADGLVSV